MNRFFTFFVLALFWSAASVADIINVPGDQSTIQAGINAAANGDTVLVADNTYFENINLKGKAITVGSYYILDADTNHINNTIINGSQPSHPDSGSVVYFISGEDTNSVLYGFTITGGTGTVAYFGLPERDGTGIFNWNSGAKIEKNKIINNHITAAGDTACQAAGINITGDAGDYIVIRDNDISQNSATAIGANNVAGSTVILATKESCVFENNRVTNNVSNSNMRAAVGGLLIYGGLDYEGPYFIRNNIISHNILNAPDGSGGGVMVLDTSPELTNNIISDNVAAANAGGIWVTNTSSPTGITEPLLINNTITNNSANSATGIGGGIRVNGQQVSAIVMNSILWGNNASSGSQIHTSAGGSIEVRYSDVQGGWPGTGNIDADPQFEDQINFYLTNGSPCIDAGDPDPIYNDPEDPANPGFALWGRPWAAYGMIWALTAGRDRRS
jgi:hypothetical protein